MSSKEQSVTLLRRNKRAQVDAFRSVGMTNLPYDSKASSFARRIKWAGGILDLTVAAVRKSDRVKLYYTKEEWNDLSMAERNNVVLLGIRVRAFGKCFLLSAFDLGSYRWGVNGAIEELTALKNANAADYDDKGNTDKVIADRGSEDNIFSRARAYKAFTSGEVEDLDFDDDTEWNVPAAGHLAILYRIKNELNELLSSVWDSSAAIKNAVYWSSSMYDNNQGWNTNISSALWSYAQKSSTYIVRPICTID